MEIYQWAWYYLNGDNEEHPGLMADECVKNIGGSNFYFAAGEALDFMVLNRRYEGNNLNQIDDLTTYIDPSKYNQIFADTSLTAQNFWVQTAVQMEVRRNIYENIRAELYNGNSSNHANDRL